jgi:hypothetical protein
MVGEGTGFGVPVLQYLNDMYFSGESSLFLSRREGVQVIRKEFLMNRAPRRKIRNSKIQSRMLVAFWRCLNELYMKHRRWRFIIRMSISRRVGIRTRFAEVPPAGKVILTYKVSNSHIDVKVDLGLVEKKGLKNVFLLNELGSNFLRRYSDSDGTKLLDNQIGAWEVVEAAQATMTDINGKLGFSLSQITGGIMRRGREYIKGFQDWAGLDYEVIPNGNDAFEYEIQTVRG